MNESIAYEPTPVFTFRLNENTDPSRVTASGLYEPHFSCNHHNHRWF